MSTPQSFYGLGECVRIAASTTSAREAFPAITTGQRVTMRVFNGSSAVAHLKTGAASVTAVVTDTFIAPGSTETFVVPSSHTHVAVILSAGTGPIYIQRGSGV